MGLFACLQHFLKQKIWNVSLTLNLIFMNTLMEHRSESWWKNDKSRTSFANIVENSITNPVEMFTARRISKSQLGMGTISITKAASIYNATPISAFFTLLTSFYRILINETIFVKFCPAICIHKQEYRQPLCTIPEE